MTEKDEKERQAFLNYASGTFSPASKEWVVAADQWSQTYYQLRDGKLYLNYNKLSILPAGIGRLRNLTHLDASLNDLRTLPPEIGMLVNLKQLLLFDNNITFLPPELGSLFQLEVLGIDGNPIPSEHKEIIMEEHGTSKLIEHFRETAQGNTYISFDLSVKKTTSNPN